MYNLQWTFVGMFVLLHFTSVDAVTLTGSSVYAVPGSGFTLTCDVPEEAQGVWFYRRPEVTSEEGAVQVGGDQCYNLNAVPPVLCTPDICSCVASGGIGTVFRWIIQPQTGDHGSVWFCRRTNTNLPNQSLDSADYTLNIADGPGTSIALSPPDTSYTKTEWDTLPDITCTAECRPDCTFIWTRPDNTNFSVSPVLSLGQLTRSAHGTYKCTARNVVGESTSTLSVSVTYGPTTVILTPSTDSYTITEGQTIPKVTCSADCNPTCSYSWTRDGQSHTTGSDLHLTNIQPNDEGIYKCTATNSYGNDVSNDITVTVDHGPGTSVALSPPDTTNTKTEGDTLLDITCTADCRPDCTFVWTRPDNTNFTVSPVLSLGQLARSEHGTYRCTARNGVGESTVTTRVIVQYGPGTSIALSPPDTTYTKTEGETLPDITCTADCRPDCTFVWTRPNNINFTVSPVLSLGQLERTEHGTYRCIARNVVEERTTTTTIVLQYGPSIVSLTPQTMTYTPHEDSTIPTITCSADCNPTCDYRWTKDGQFHTTGSNLHLTDIQRNEGGIYRCTATNKFGSRRTDDVSVTVYYGPDGIITLSPPDTTYTRTEGNTLPNITCTAECRPGCTFVWTQPDNTNFTVSPVLSLGQLARSEHGTYRCTARNIVGESITTVNVIVQYGPGTVSLSPTDTTYTRKEGDTLPDIACTADCRPDCTFVWTRPDNTNFTVSPVLSLGQLKRSEHGTYKCIARNVVGESTSTTSVIVHYGPGDSISFEPQQDIVDVAENQTITNVTCSADCRPLCTYIWSKSGTNYPDPLSLSVATRTNAGQYTCRANNTVGQGTKTWNLIARFPPQILEVDYSQGDANVREHESKSLICTVESYPPSTIQWLYKANNTILLNTPDVLDSTYTLTNAKCLDTGLYTCVAKNSVSTTAVTRDIPVNVLCKPRPHPQDDDLKMKFGLGISENLTIPAVFLANPEPFYNWTFQRSSGYPGTDLVNGTDNFVISNAFGMRNLSALSLGTREDMQEHWYGLYNVMATNSEGSGWITFTVEAQEKPGLPKSLIAGCAEPNVVEVSWVDGGNAEFYQVLFSVDKYLNTKEIYPVTIPMKTDGNQTYSQNVHNLEGGQVYFFKVIAYNTYGNKTSLDAVGCTVQKTLSGGNDSLFAAAVVLMVISVITLLSTIGLGIFIRRNRRLPFIKGHRHEQKEFQNIQISEQDVTSHSDDGRSPYQQLNTDAIGKPSIYSEIGQHDNQGYENESVESNDDRKYESLEGRSNPNVYEELQGTTSGNRGIYVNTKITSDHKR